VRLKADDMASLCARHRSEKITKNKNRLALKKRSSQQPVKAVWEEEVKLWGGDLWHR